MFKLLYHKFIRDNVYQVLSESTGFCGRYDNKHFGVFFSGSQCTDKSNDTETTCRDSCRCFAPSFMQQIINTIIIYIIIYYYYYYTIIHYINT